MSLLEDITPAPRKVMTIFYLVDTSTSMTSKIGTLNKAMSETIPMLKEISHANDDAEIKVAVLQFSSGCSWITSNEGPVSIDRWRWNNLEANGITDFGHALIEIDKQLSRERFLKSQTGAYAPVVILLSDGAPTDNWEKGLQQLKKNNWFKHAIKIAIDIEGGSDRNVLEAFTGTIEAILDARNLELLKRMIHKVSVRASEFQSHSKQSEDVISSPEEDSADIVKEVLSEIKDEEYPEEWEEW